MTGSFDLDLSIGVDSSGFNSGVIGISKWFGDVITWPTQTTKTHEIVTFSICYKIAKHARKWYIHWSILLVGFLVSQMNW